MRVWLTKIHAR